MTLARRRQENLEPLYQIIIKKKKKLIEQSPLTLSLNSVRGSSQRVLSHFGSEF